ncbi:MAG: hypothetical protein KDB60_14630 [Propionibacteriaceae bacterium]|nr:hypothetical protein [Propionibacteriaceae bacterium]
MSQYADLFVAIAEIAGVFVGFAALIGVARRGDVTTAQLGQIRAVVSLGLVVVVAALVPVGLGLYGLPDRALWTISGLIFLALVWTVIILSLRARENRQLVVSQARTSPVAAAFFWVLLELPIQVPLLLAILGIFPGLGPAFYLTALAFNLFEAAFVLALLVYAQVSDPAQ